MTVQTDSGGMVVDLQAELPMPQLQPQQQQSRSSSVYMPDVADIRPTMRRYRRGGPTVTPVDLWGKNGYYMNGPGVDPFDMARTQARQIEAYTKSWADSAKFAQVDRYVKLLNKYGHTNSPGVLWSMAVANVPEETQPAQRLLLEDAKETARTNISSFPVTGASPQANNQDNDPMDLFWKPVEAISRNAFAGLIMPLQAVTGAIGGIGGELTDQNAPWFDMTEGRISGAVAQLGSLAVPPISLWADRVRGDNDFVNPWEQTEFGQTLLSMASGAGMDAFSTQQAGLDLNRAKDELRSNPDYAVLETTPDGIAQFNEAAVNLAKEKGYYGDPGWFINETSVIGEAQRQATFKAWAIPAPDGQLTSWTVGRGIASNIAGPNYTAYAAMSGLIDAVWSVTADPTIIGGKFGVISKSMRGLGRLAEKAGVEGAEAVLTVGKEARKAREQYALTMQELNKARILANINREGGDQDLITAVDVARMQVEDMRDLVREAKISDRVIEYKSKFNADTNEARIQAREARRAAGRAMVIDNGILAPAQRGTGIAEVEADIALLKASRDSLYRVRNGQVEMTRDRFYDFFNRVRENPDELERHNRLMEEFNVLFEEGNYGTTPADDYQAMNDMIDALRDRSTLTVQRAEDVPLEQVQNDMTRMFLNQGAEAEEAALKQLNYDGVILADELVTGEARLSSINGNTVVSYWRGEQEPVFAAASEIIPISQRQSIKASLMQFLDQPGMAGLRKEYPDVAPDSMTKQAVDALARAADPRGQLDAMMSSDIVTFGRVLDFASRYGLDTILDDILRSSAGIDGIKSLDRASGRVAWMGNHPSVVSYAVSDVARSVGKEAAVALDPEAAIAQADLTQIGLSPMDLRGMPVEELQRMSYDMAKKSTKYLRKMDQLADRTYTKARLGEDALNSEIEIIVRETEDTKQALRRNLQYLGGMRNTKNGSIMLDERGVREFLFGRGPASFLANKALDAIANPIPQAEIDALQSIPKFKDEIGTLSDEWQSAYVKVLGRLNMLTGNKWFTDTYQAVADAILEGGGRESVLSVLSTRLGIDVSQGTVSRTTALLAGDGSRQFQTWRKLSERAARAVGQMPTMRTMNLQNGNEVIENIYLYGRYGQVPEETLSKYVGEVLLADGTLKSIGVNRNAIARVFDDISDVMLERLDGKLGKVVFAGTRGQVRKQQVMSALRSSTRLWLGGETDLFKTNTQMAAEMADVNRVLDMNGNPFMLPDIKIETELATGTLSLPSVDDWSAALSRLHMTLARSPLGEKAYVVAKDFFDNFFRAGLLVFRVAYIIRNLAEMQVRMFLNGHQSMFSDPMTLAGMTLGPAIQAKLAAPVASRRADIIEEMREALGRKPDPQEIEAALGRNKDLFDLVGGRYANTILDTSFEVGNDVNLAVANHVLEYFTMTRMSHSLTDPRVYNSAVRQGWQNVQYGTPKFNYGWAHELMMLHNSDIVRVMLDPPPGIPFQGAMMDKEEIIKFLQSSEPRAIAIRSKMIGADERFQQVFNDEQLMREWLFDSANSVQNRVTQFTNNDPRLIEYLRTGELSWNLGESVRISGIASPQDRVTTFGGLLGRHFNDATWESHFATAGNGRPVGVPWIEPGDIKHGFGFFDWFFRVANKVERMGAVGPEFRMAYWSKIAELAPGLRRSDVDRALKAARTTLSPITRLDSSGKMVNIGSKHPAFSALEKAKASNDDGMMTLDDLHEMAIKYAADDVKNLFYDAAKRNKFWYGLRLLIPFGQSWGNTMRVWSKLGQKGPIQVYKMQKALNALTESGSNVVYDIGAALPGPLQAYGDYAPGTAPWDQDVNGGFFYSDERGDTAFVYPYVGRAQAMALNVVGAMQNGFSSPYDITEVPVQSAAQSLNVALGSEGIFPGISAVGGTILNSPLLPSDNDIIDGLRKIAMPFGESNILQGAIAAWLGKAIAGVSTVPVVGDVASSFLDILAPAHKNKYQRDAQFILATSGNYENWATDPLVLQRMQEDASSLAKALLFTTGLIQNVLPSTPYVMPTVKLSGEEFKGAKEVDNERLYTIAILNNLFQQYVARNNQDYTAAHQEWVKDLGPAALFAASGDWVAFGRMGKSNALKFATKNPEIAKAYPDYFPLFFPGGDSSDAMAMTWLRKFGPDVLRRKTADEVTEDVITTLQRIQSERINSMEFSGVVSEEEAQAMREELDERFADTDVTTGTFKDKTLEMEQLNNFVNRFSAVRNSEAGQAFAVAWSMRESALQQARDFTGDPNTGLGSKKVVQLKEWLINEMFQLEEKYPDFALLGAKFRREWE